MTCTICLLLLLVAEAVFFTEIYKRKIQKEKKLNSLFRICTYRDIQMKINVDLRVNVLCIFSRLYDFCITASQTHLAVVKIGSSFTQAGTDSCLTGNLMVSSFDLKNI